METAENTKFVYEFGKFLLDPNDRTLRSDGEVIHLTAKEFETLLMLVENNGRALTKEELLSRVWSDAVVEEGSLAKQISRLRKVLNTNDEHFIETLPKHGYRFSAELHRVVPQSDDSVIFEKRTVRRVKFAFDDRVERDRPALPKAHRRFYRTPWVLTALVVTIGLGYLVWHYRSELFTSSPAPSDPYAAVQLTDTPDDDTGPQWTKDGRIRFSRVFPDNRVEMWIMNPDGTGQTAIPMPDGKRILSWSPDERKILFQKDDDATNVYLSRADGSGELLLPFRGGTWSPDASMIAYRAKVADDNWEVFVYSIETGKSRNVSNSESFDSDPSFSHDAKRVAFVSGRDGNGEIYTVNIDGSDIRRLTFDPGIDSHPAFSPDGTQISFNSDREHENSDVYLMNADGSGRAIKLTNFDKSNETAGPGGWSPDGTNMAFFSDRNGKDDIYLIRAETVRPVLVVANPDRDLRGFSYSPDGRRIVYAEELADKSGELKLLDLETGRPSVLRKTELATSPEWSPLGDWIAFHDRIGGNSEICIVRPDGQDFRNLTNDPSLDAGPAWSPDGKRLVFGSYRGDPTRVPQLYIMNADGTEPQPVTPRKGWEGDASWWPDGKRIVFACDRGDTPGAVLDVCQISMDGTGERRILFHWDHDSQPRVAPDGNRIAFVATADGNPEIYLVNGDGSGRLRLTRDSADDRWPGWSADGKKLRFVSNRKGKFAIYEIDMQ